MVDFLGEGRNRYPTTYTIFVDGGVGYAQNGESGDLDYSDADHDAVLQYAIDTIETAGTGGKIFVRGGDYNFNTSINIMENDLTLEFESSVNITVTTAINGFNIGDATHPVYRTHLIGNGCVIDHSGVGGGIAFSFYDAHNGTIQGFHLSNWEGGGIQWNRSWYNDMFLNQIDTGGTAVIIDGVPGARTNHLRIRHNSFGPGAGQTCLEIVNYGRNILIDQNVFSDAANGVIDHSSMNLKVTNNWFESLTGIHIDIQGDTDTCLHPKIMGNTHIAAAGQTAIRLDDCEEPVVGHEKVDGGGGGGSFVTTTANTVNLTVESSWHSVAPYNINAATTGGAIMEPGSAVGVGMGGGARIVFGDKNAAAVAGDFYFDPTAGDGMEGFVYDRANNRLYWYADGGVHYVNEAGTNRPSYTYTIFIDGANAYVQNNDTGVLDFNSADHDAAIQYAIDQIEAGAAGGSVLLKRGAYACNTTIDIMENDFKMEFEAGTVLTFSGAIDGFNIGDATHQVLRCTLIGNGAWIEHAASAGLIAFSFYDTHFSSLINFNIGDTPDWGATGVKWDRSWHNEMKFNRIVNCTTCIEIDGVPGARTNHLNINHNYMGGGTTGINIVNYGRNLKIEQNIIASLTNGIHDHSSMNLHIKKNFFELNTTNDIYIHGDTDTCIHPKIEGNTHILSGTLNAIYLDDCEEVIIRGNEVSGGALGSFITKRQIQ